MTETLGYELRRLRLMRLALTRATAKWSTGGKLKTQGRPKTITLAGQVPFMSRTFTTIYVVMRDGAPVGAYTDKLEAAAHSRAIGGPGKGHAIGLVTLELVHGTRPHPGEEHQLDEHRPRKEERR